MINLKIITAKSEDKQTRKSILVSNSTTQFT